MKEGDKRIKRLRIVFMLIFVTVLVLFTVLLVVSTLFVISWGNEGVENEFETYKYYQLDPDFNRSTVGLVTLRNDIGDDGFRSYIDSSGNYILISELQLDEFVCTGSCFCEEDYRRNSMSISRGFVSLVAAMTTLVAFDKAREHFQDHCTQFSRDECSSGSAVHWEIDDCEIDNVIPDEVIDLSGDDWEPEDDMDLKVKNDDEFSSGPFWKKPSFGKPKYGKPNYGKPKVQDTPKPSSTLQQQTKNSILRKKVSEGQEIYHCSGHCQTMTADQLFDKYKIYIRGKEKSVRQKIEINLRRITSEIDCRQVKLSTLVAVPRNKMPTVSGQFQASLLFLEDELAPLCTLKGEKKIADIPFGLRRCVSTIAGGKGGNISPKMMNPSVNCVHKKLKSGGGKISKTRPRAGVTVRYG